MSSENPSVNAVDPVETLQRAFLEFSERAEKLSQAYGAMQEDFGRLNLELDRKNVELAESLMRQEETGLYLGSVLQSMTNGVIGIDNAGIITIFNSAAEQILLRRSSDVVGRLYTAVFETSPGDQSGSARSILEDGHDGAAGEKVFWTSAGTPVQATYQCSLLRDHDGRILGSVEIFNDISRIRALEAEIQSNKTMAALGEMAATVAHEIRNPLGAMGVWAGLLDRDIDKGDPRKETLARIVDALSRLNRIVSSLLVYSRPVRAEFRPVVLQEVLAEGAGYVEVEAMRSGQQVVIETAWNETEPVLAHADPEKLSQIILNLSLNALQAMPEGGTLTISCQREGEYASFCVTDTGIGMDEEQQSRMFAPFFTTKENGTGLGLAIVRKYVEHHSGYINVKSVKGAGTSVQVFLPVAAS